MSEANIIANLTPNQIIAAIRKPDQKKAQVLMKEMLKSGHYSVQSIYEVLTSNGIKISIRTVYNDINSK